MLLLLLLHGNCLGRCLLLQRRELLQGLMLVLLHLVLLVLLHLVLLMLLWLQLLHDCPSRPLGSNLPFPYTHDYLLMRHMRRLMPCSRY